MCGMFIIAESRGLHWTWIYSMKRNDACRICPRYWDPSTSPRIVPRGPICRPVTGLPTPTGVSHARRRWSRAGTVLPDTDGPNYLLSATPSQRWTHARQLFAARHCLGIRIGSLRVASERCYVEVILAPVTFRTFAEVVQSGPNPDQGSRAEVDRRSGVRWSRRIRL